MFLTSRIAKANREETPTKYRYYRFTLLELFVNTVSVTGNTASTPYYQDFQKPIRIREFDFFNKQYEQLSFENSQISASANIAATLNGETSFTGLIQTEPTGNKSNLATAIAPNPPFFSIARGLTGTTDCYIEIDFSIPVSVAKIEVRSSSFENLASYRLTARNHTSQSYVDLTGAVYLNGTDDTEELITIDLP